MLTGYIHPSTVEGIKSLAAQIRKEQGMKHSVALDLAAKAANFANYKHALRTLSDRRKLPESTYVLLTAYWYDRGNGHRVGRETLRVSLRRPILETCPRSDLKLVRGFGWLRMVAPDHFVRDAIAGSQSNAREDLTSAARSLRFMEYTGLRPSRGFRKTYPKGVVEEKLPGNDHATNWIDPSTGQFILIDEPYSGVPDEAKRAAWAQRVGWQVIKTSWPGMYFPHSCDLYVAADVRGGYDLGKLVSEIDAMPPPLLEKHWAGDSSTSWETFVSPMAKSEQDARRARCRGMIYPSATKTTLPYSYNMGESRRRPAAEMAVDDHIKVGGLIKAVLRSSHRPYGVYKRMDSVRSTLEDWLSIEIGRRQLNGPEFFDVYYRETEDDAVYHRRAASRPGVVAMLGELKQKLQETYPDCAPLRQQLRKIDVSIALMSRMKPTKS
jgi:hypothetical protein